MHRLPLHGLHIRSDGETLGTLAITVLESLGAVHDGGHTPRNDACRADEDWEASGLAPLTGRPGEPPLRPRGSPAGLASAYASAIEFLSTRVGHAVHVNGPALLSQRARLQSWTRNGSTSLGGSARLLAATDGWCALNLPREDDRELVPALVGERVFADHWSTAARWIATQPCATVVERANLLGIAAAEVGSWTENGPPWLVRPRGRGRPAASRLVVNLGSLWAAPLCAQLLHRTGFQAVDVESPDRPDGARAGMPAFFAELHAGHDRVQINLATSRGVSELRELLRAASVVITGSRVAALERLGATRGAVDAPHDQVWVAVTGYGRTSNRIAFGDDAAAAGGLVAWDALGPVFVGDAVADPLTGLAAATACLAALSAGGGWDIDVTLAGVAAVAARP